MTRVVLVVWGFETFGGMERHVVELALGLHRAGIEAVVVSEMPVRRRNAYAARLRAGGVTLLAAGRRTRIANGLLLALQPRHRRPAMIHGSGLLSRQLGRTLNRFGLGGNDVIHVHGCRLGQSWVMDWARSRGIACVYTEHVDVVAGGGPLMPDGPELAAQAGALSCVSEHSRASLASLFTTPPRIVVTGHIVATPSELPPCASGPDRFQILCPARLEPHKGVDVLLRAFATLLVRHPRAELLVVGDGAQRRELVRLADDLAITRSIRFTGALPPEAVASLILDADVVALPSLSEALPLALLEAMASAVPVVATRVGGIPEMIETGSTGLLVEPGDVAGLAAALATLAGDPALRRRLGEAGSRRFQASPHHEAKVIPAMLELYRHAGASC